jgi:lysozyme
MRLLGFILFPLVLASTSASAEDFRSDPTHITSLSQVEALENGSLGAAEVGVRVLMALALDLIKDFEGWVPRPYNDASAYCTIGYGHLIARKPCARSPQELEQFAPPLSEADGLALLNKDTAIARSAVQRLVTQPLTDEQFGALTSFIFNVGIANFETSSLRRYINNGEDDQAAPQFARWIMSGGKIIDGLIIRRACEAGLFQGVLVYEADHKFHRDDCGALGAAPEASALIDIAVGEQR